jgi:hypothetical protein
MILSYYPSVRPGHLSLMKDRSTGSSKVSFLLRYLGRYKAFTLQATELAHEFCNVILSGMQFRELNVFGASQEGCGKQ